MSENPVRNASEEAAKSYLNAEWDEGLPKSLLEAHLTDIIESKFAPVVAAAAEGAPCHPAACRDEMLWRETMAKEVAAAEEAMKEKCRQIVRRVRILDAMNGTVGPTPFAAEIDAEIRAVPTGTVLAEHPEDAVWRALARMFYLVEHPDELVAVSEASDSANDYAHAVRELMEQAIAVAVEKSQVDAAVKFHKMQKGKVERATAELRAKYDETIDANSALIFELEEKVTNLKAQLAEVSARAKWGLSDDDRREKSVLQSQSPICKESDALRELGYLARYWNTSGVTAENVRDCLNERIAVLSAEKEKQHEI